MNTETRKNDQGYSNQLQLPSYRNLQQTRIPCPETIVCRVSHYSSRMGKHHHALEGTF
ncbi:hypothetical protein Hanom_Chr17g01580411 [Helianthus anomalus]